MILGPEDRAPAAAPIILGRVPRGTILTMPVNLSDGIERRRLLTYGELVITFDRRGEAETMRIQEMPAQLQELLPS